MITHKAIRHDATSSRLTMTARPPATGARPQALCRSRVRARGRSTVRDGRSLAFQTPWRIASANRVARRREPAPWRRSLAAIPEALTRPQTLLDRLATRSTTFLPVGFGQLDYA